jgi:hypothetical protein
MCDEARGKPRCLIVDKDGYEIAAVNPYRETWNENAALIARAPELRARVAELEQALTIDGIEDLIKTRDRLESELAHSNCYLTKSEEFCAKADAEIARLRELLRRVVDSASGDDFGSVGGELLAEIKKELGK